MQFKKCKAILAAVMAAAMTVTAIVPVAASAERTKAEKFGDETYAQRFMSLYDDVYTNGIDNGYLSKNGVPYHSVEELICEAPDYGHETTSEAMSYIVWIAAMHDHLVDKKVVDGASGKDLANAWKTLEALIPSGKQQPGIMEFDGSSKKLSSQVSAEYPMDIAKYPSTGSSSNTGENPLHAKMVSAYKSAYEGEYLLHWLADVDDWYGFGGSARGTKGDLTFINTFQRGDQESCFETIPHPSIETLKYGTDGAGMKFAFQSSTAKSWSYTNAPDAEDRAIQAVYAADRWGVGDASVSKKAGMLGDYCRNDMYDKYYKTIGIGQKGGGMTAESNGGAGEAGKHYLMSWYTSWGGADDGMWAWQIGCSHSHQFYQNPLAAFGLLVDDAMKMEAEGAKDDYEESLKRQLEMYLWLSSAEGPFAGGCTNCWMGDYEAYPSGVPTFYDMAYIEQPVYADPGSNNWTGNQYWATQRLCELYYIVKTDKDAAAKVSKITPGGMSIEEALKTVLDKWVAFFVKESKVNAETGLMQIPSSLKWSGAPETWNGKYQENTGLKASVAGMQNTDLGCVCSLANSLIYYAKANGVEASGTVAEGTDLASKGLHLAQTLLDQTWKIGRDNIGLTVDDHNGSLARFWEQEVDTDEKTGKYPYGYEVGPGSKFIDFRPMYKDEGQSYSKLYSELEAAYKKDKEAGAKMHEWKETHSTSDYKYGTDCSTDCSEFKNVESVVLRYHRFWHAGDIMMALGTMADLYPDVVPDGTKPGPEPGDTDWGNLDCSEGATPKDRVTVADAVLLARLAGGDSTISSVLTDTGKANGDVVNDGKFDSSDLQRLLDFIVGKVEYSVLGTKA